MARTNELQRAIETLLTERNQLDQVIRRLEHIRDAKPARKPRTPKAKTAAGSATGHGGTS